MHIILFCIMYLLACCTPAFSVNAGNNVSSEKKIIAELFSTQPQSRIVSCMLSPQALQDILNKGEDLLFIDVRRSDEFQKFRIPGSINIPLYSVKTKRFLKPKSLILTNEGYGYRGLEQECEKLQNLGFQSVRILYGGLNHWRDTNGRLEGDFFAIEAINEILPAKYFVDRNYDDWVVIDVSPKEDETEHELIPDITNIPYSGNDQEFKSKLEEFIGSQDYPLLKYLLIVNGDGQNYWKIKQAFKNDKKISNIFYLRGGLAGYGKYLEEQKAVWNPHKKTVDKCGSCP